MQYKLGKLAPSHDPRTLKLASYLTLPEPPTSCDWTKKVKAWGMFANDHVGCCTCSSVAHMVEAWTANAHGRTTIATDKAVLAMYSAVSGYDPKDPSTDQGAVMLDVLKHFRKKGLRIPLPGNKASKADKCFAFAAVPASNSNMVKSTISLFGGAYCGLALPLSAQKQDVWDVPEGGTDGHPGSWGGHAVEVVAYDEAGLTCASWGQLKKMTWSFFFEYCDELYAVLGLDWLKKGRSPTGLNLAALQADLALL